MQLDCTTAPVCPSPGQKTPNLAPCTPEGAPRGREGAGSRVSAPGAASLRFMASDTGRSSHAGTCEDSDIYKAAGGKVQTLERRLPPRNPQQASPRLQPGLFVKYN